MIHNGYFFKSSSISAGRFKAMMVIDILAVIIYSVALFVPRPGVHEKDIFFYLLLGMAIASISFLAEWILLKRWQGIWIKDNFIYINEVAYEIIPRKRKINISDIIEINYIISGVYWGNEPMFSFNHCLEELKNKVAKKISEQMTEKNFPASLDEKTENGKLLPFCQYIEITSKNGEKIRLDFSPLMLVKSWQFNNKNAKDINKFLSFLPAMIKYYWHWGKIWRNPHQYRLYGR